MNHHVTSMAAAPPDAVFDLITDLDRLPEWIANMSAVVERPPALVPGVEWVVEFRAMGQKWRSRSRVETLDSERRVFAYRSGTDDGNPSFAMWQWRVGEDG